MNGSSLCEYAMCFIFASLALKDSSFFGQEIPIVGIHQGNCISFAFGHTGPTGDTVASFTPSPDSNAKGPVGT